MLLPLRPRLATIQLSGDEDGTDLERRANAQLLDAAPPLRAFVDLVARRPCECSSRALRENESECDACAARDLLLDIDRPAREARMAKGGAQ